MTEFEAGAPCWVELSVPDLEAGKHFYGALFGWSFEGGTEDYGFYTDVRKDGKSVGGLLPGQTGASAAWTLYLATADAEELASRIGAAGGKVDAGPTKVGDVGYQLLATDPGGAAFGAWQAGTRGGFEIQGQPGSFFWPEIYTRDKESVDPFYEAVFGYAGQQVSEEPFDFKLWSLPDKPYPCAARLQMGEGMPADIPAHALVYFSVSDTDAAVEKVRELGGSVSREPSDSPFGRSALVSDQQGARFALMGPVANSTD
ncbi:VOC family protein [Streptomyces apocyni]|uniref:VOC family protein n=1 Tax=Streptomyces apocyni TaxID=2654677 RepID=UPI0012EA781C|nr:VOC family protein [Streptomyces apocyni]